MDRGGKRMKYGIVIFPTSDIMDFANGYRKRYDPNYAMIRPHLTVKGVFEADTDGIEDISGYLETVTSSVAPFEVVLNRFSNFHPTNNVIYMEVANPKLLKDLHEKIHFGVLAFEEPYSYIPHITIGQKMTDDELQDVYSSLRMKRFDYRFQAGQIHLLCQGDDMVWKEHRVFPLRG
jgi:2'-5' RNA ligase